MASGRLSILLLDPSREASNDCGDIQAGYPSWDLAVVLAGLQASL